MGLRASAFTLGFSKCQALLQHLLGVAMNRGEIKRVWQCLSTALARPMQEALAFVRQQPVPYVDKACAHTGNDDDNNPNGKQGWLWIMVTSVVSVFIQGLRGSTSATSKCCAAQLAGLW